MAEVGKRITELPSATSLENSDLFVIVIDTDTVPEDRKITFSGILSVIASGIPSEINADAFNSGSTLSGYVLTADGYGESSWQPPTGQNESSVGSKLYIYSNFS